MNRPKQGGLDSDAGHSMALASERIHSEGREMNKQSSKSSRSATSASAPAGRAHFARLVSHLIPAFGLAALAGAPSSRRQRRTGHDGQRRNRRCHIGVAWLRD